MIGGEDKLTGQVSVSRSLKKPYSGGHQRKNSRKNKHIVWKGLEVGKRSRFWEQKEFGDMVGKGVRPRGNEAGKEGWAQIVCVGHPRSAGRSVRGSR